MIANVIHVVGDNRQYDAGGQEESPHEQDHHTKDHEQHRDQVVEGDDATGRNSSVLSIIANWDAIVSFHTREHITKIIDAQEQFVT